MSAPEREPRSGWHTSEGKSGKAHLYVEDRPACGDRKGIWPGGVTVGELFTRPTRPSTREDHVCTYCARVEPRVCDCWTCRTRRVMSIARTR